MTWKTPSDHQWTGILLFTAMGAMAAGPNIGKMLIAAGVLLAATWTLAFVGGNLR